MDQVLKKKMQEAKNATEPVASPAPAPAAETHKVKTIKLQTVSTTPSKQQINLSNYNQVKNNSSEVKKSNEIKLTKLNITTKSA